MLYLSHPRHLMFYVVILLYMFLAKFPFFYISPTNLRGKKEKQRHGMNRSGRWAQMEASLAHKEGMAHHPYMCADV